MKFLKHMLYQLKITNIQALLVLDAILLPLALVTSILLRLGGEWDHRLDSSIWIFFVLPIWTIPIFINLGLYRAVLKYVDDKIVLIILYGVSSSVLILIIVTYFANIRAIPITSIIIFWIFALAYIGGSRFLLRGILRNFTDHDKTNVAIYGAGSAGIQTCISLQNSHQYNVVAFFDDDKSKWNSTIKGISVFRPKDIPKILRSKNIEQVLLAIPSMSHGRRKTIINQLEPLSIKIKTLPSYSELISGQVTINDIKEIDIEDLLGRDAIPSDIELLSKNITGKVILITGAGGSIGSELVRQIATLAPKQLVLLDISEYALYAINMEISNNFPHISKIDILGNITNKPLIEHVIKKYQVNTIFHAAAYKHVPLVEFNPLSGIANNAVGTYIVALTALECNVDNMVLISTDKAVRPTNIMGASKRFAEIILQAFNQESKHTIFTMVRFGNVLGSSGSVVPLFKNQIKNGGPVTVTHPDIIRYFMTIPEAVQLVIQAGTMATGGEVFILDMGEPVKILDLAIRMIHLSGLSVKNTNFVDGDIEINFTGLRPGEKLFEELLIGNNPEKTAHQRIMKANENFIKLNKLQTYLAKLDYAIAHNCTNDAIAILKKVVPDFQSSNIAYSELS